MAPDQAAVAEGTIRMTKTRKEEAADPALKRAIRIKWKNSILAWTLLAPSLLFLAVFTIYPIVKSIYSSLFKDNLSTITPMWNGLGNYQALLADPVFQECFFNNLLIAVVTIPVSMGLAVLLAVLSNRLKWGKSFVRLGFIYPTFIPLVAAANIWMFIYTPIYGLLGYLNPEWRILADGTTAIWAIMVMLIWKQTGYIISQGFMELIKNFMKPPEWTEREKSVCSD